MPDLRDSETAKNLMRAFAGESQARNRYTLSLIHISSIQYKSGS